MNKNRIIAPFYLFLLFLLLVIRAKRSKAPCRKNSHRRKSARRVTTLRELMKNFYVAGTAS